MSYQILVVEDSLADQEIIRESFSSCGHHCILTFATSLAEARTHLASSRFHLLILDIMLGWENGLDLVQEVRSDPRLAAIPIVALSARVDQASQAYQLGVNTFIVKSFEYSEFAKKIQSLMNFWVHTAELPERAQSTLIQRQSA